MSNRENDQPSPAPADIVAVSERLRLTGRNDPCPCRSGRKYKKCCLTNDELRVREASRAFADRLRSRAGRAPVGEPLEPGDIDDVIDIEAESVDVSATDDGLPDNLPTTDIEENPPVAPEVERALDELWTEFDRLKHPSTEQMDAHLARLLTLPPEATLWNDVFQLFARHEHADLAGVFRRIATGVPPTKATALSFFYWGAIEKFISTGRVDLVPEVVRYFCALDRETYDADALHHVGQWLLAAGCDAEALALAERFLLLWISEISTPHAMRRECREVFELRVGARLRDAVGPPADPVAVARELLRDIEKEIHADYAERAALVICGVAPPLVLTQRDFDLPVDEGREGERSWQDALQHFEALMHVAREAWQIERRPPGCAFRGLWLLVDAACNEREERSLRPNKARGKTIGNLLECLQPSGLERRVASNAHDILGTNPPQAHVLFETHGTLLGFARRHALIDADLADRTELQLLQLKNKLGFPG